MVKRKTASPVAVVEAAYDLEVDDHAWLGNVTRALAPLIDDGHGITSYLYDVSTMPGRWFCKQSIGMSREHEMSEAALFDDNAVVAGHRYITEPVGGAVDAARQLARARDRAAGGAR